MAHRSSIPFEECTYKYSTDAWLKWWRFVFSDYICLSSLTCFCNLWKSKDFSMFFFWIKNLNYSFNRMCCWKKKKNCYCNAECHKAASTYLSKWVSCYFLFSLLFPLKTHATAHHGLLPVCCNSHLYPLYLLNILQNTQVRIQTQPE